MIKTIPKKKSLQALKKDLDKVFHEYIRLRDQYNGMFDCISCGQIKSTRLMHAGHYHSAGHNESVRWDEDNVHGQCEHCNTFLHGNLINYSRGIIQRIGLHKVQSLEIRRHNKSKMFAFEISILIIQYKDKIKKLKG